MILFLTGMIAIIPVARHDIASGSAFVAALVATAALVPTTVTETSTVAAYIPPTQARGNPLVAPWVTWVHNLALGIATIFDLSKDQFGINVAGIFGLTPTLLTARLERIADQYKLDLKTTVASSTPSAQSPSRM